LEAPEAGTPIVLALFPIFANAARRIWGDCLEVGTEEACGSLAVVVASKKALSGVLAEISRMNGAVCRRIL